MVRIENFQFGTAGHVTSKESGTSTVSGKSQEAFFGSWHLSLNVKDRWITDLRSRVEILARIRYYLRDGKEKETKTEKEHGGSFEKIGTQGCR